MRVGGGERRAESGERSRETQQEMRGKESERRGWPTNEPSRRDTINGRDRCIPDEITHGGGHGAIHTHTNTQKYASEKERTNGDVAWNRESFITCCRQWKPSACIAYYSYTPRVDRRRVTRSDEIGEL